jgi:PAS domain S-box-containing protein
MAIASPDGRFLAVNERFCRLVRRKERELLTMDIPSVTPPADRAMNDARNRRLFRGESPAIRTPKRYLRADGVSVPAHLTAGIVRGKDGSVLFAVGSVIPE